MARPSHIIYWAAQEPDGWTPHIRIYFDGRDNTTQHAYHTEETRETAFRRARRLAAREAQSRTVAGFGINVRPAQPEEINQ